MRRSSRFFLWLVATAATTTVAYVAVNAAGSEVNGRPLAGVVAASPSTSSTSSSSTTTLAPSTTIGTSTTPATSGTSPTTTATSAPAWQRTTLNSGGGSIIVSYRTGEVRLESVVPQAGSAYEIDDDGPTRVEVEFEAGESRYRLRAEWSDSGFATDIESDED